MNVMEGASEYKELISEKFCHTCLCGARILYTIKDQAAVKFYLDCISEITLSSSSTLCPEVCWECKAMLWKVVSFKQKIIDSNKLLQAYSYKSIEELISNNIVRPSRMSVQVNQSVDIIPAIDIEERVGIAGMRSIFVKNEADVIVKDESWDLEEENKSDDKCAEKYFLDLAHDDDNTTWSSEEKNIENKSDDKCAEKYFLDLAHDDDNTTWSSEEKNIEIKCENSITLNLDESLSKTNEKGPTGHARKRGRKKRAIKEKKRDRSKCLDPRNDSKKKKETKLKINKVIVTVKLTQEELMKERCQLRTDIGQEARICEMCHMTFADEIMLKEHLEENHNQKGENFCPVCNMLLSSDEALQKHYTKHFTRFECKVCGQRYDDKQIAQTHYQTKHGSKQLSCTSDISGKISSIEKNHRNPQSVPRSRVECTSCDKTFSHRAGLLTHTGVVHRQLDKFPCEHCGKMFKWRNSLRKHAVQHEKPKKTAESKPFCVQCDVSFASICSYKRHLRNSLKHVSQNQLKFVCDHCQQRYANKTKLRDHIEEKHLKKTFHCHICLKPSKNRVCLDQHIRNVHKGRPNNKICQYCGKGFPTKMQLESHLRAHTGERPFICEYCPTTFSQQSNLYKHYRQIHVNKLKAKVDKGNDLIGGGVCVEPDRVPVFQYDVNVI